MTRLRCRSAFGIALMFGWLLPAAETAQDDITPRFAWPDDLSGRADFTLRHESLHNANPPATLEARGSVRFTVSPNADSLTVDFDETSVAIESHVASDDQMRVAGVLVPLSLHRADYRVSRAGDFLGLDDPRDFMDAMRTAIDAGIETIPEELRVHVRPSIELTLSQENFRSVMERSWKSEVGRWIGRTLQPGRPSTADEMVDFPILGGGQVPAEVSYRFIGMAPCGNGEDGCAELEVRAVIEGPEAIGAYEQALRVTGATGLQVALYRTELTSWVTTDPDSLVPYESRLEWRQTTDLLSGADTISLRESGVLATTYTYD